MENKKKIPELRFDGFTEDWEEKKFEKVFRGIRNNSLSRDKLNYKYGQAKNIHYGDILVKFGEIVDAQKQQLPFITSNEDSESLSGSQLMNGDIILADAAEDETVGKCIEIQNINTDVIHSGLHTIAVRPLQKFAPKYLGYYMNSNSYHDQLVRLMQGTKVLSISKSAIQDTDIRFPSNKEEQDKISEYITEIDELITNHQKKHSRLVILKKSMLEKMFPKDGETVPEIRFKGFEGGWKKFEICELFRVTRGDTLSALLTSKVKNNEMKYPVYSSQTLNNGLLGYYNEFLFENAITWTTDGANAGTVNYRDGKFYSTNVNGVLLSNDGYACKAVAEILNKEAWKHVSHVGNPKLMNNVMSRIQIQVPDSASELENLSVLFNDLDALIVTQKSQILRLKNFKQSLSEKMFV